MLICSITIKIINLLPLDNRLKCFIFGLMENLIYYADPCMKETQARVEDVLPLDERQKRLVKAMGRSAEAVCAVIFDRTIFYPEGGGQPGDRGWIELGDRRLEVIDVQKLHNNVVHGGDDPAAGEDTDGGLGIVPVHFVGCPVGEISPGDQVRLILDWNHRYFFMQQHTAQHLLSGLLHSMFNIGTVSVHLGSEELTIEVSEPEVDDEKLMRLEDAANDAILEGLPVTGVFMPHDEAERLGLRREIKVSTDVRVVRIGEVDSIACGGIHVSRTSECRIILYQGQERIRGNVRLIFRAGSSAMEQIRREHGIIRRLCAANSAVPDELVQLNEGLSRSLALEKQARGKMATMLAKSIIGEKASKESGVAAFVAEGDMAELVDFKAFADASEGFDDLALAVARLDGSKMLWLIVLNGRYSEIGLGQLRQGVLDRFGCKGGGRPPVYQGMAPGADGMVVDGFLKGFVGMLEERYGKLP